MLQTQFLCSQANFEMHIIITLSIFPSVHPSVRLQVHCISPNLFKVGIPNMVCGCILGWQSVMLHSQVSETLISDLFLE